jgi:hypothetical protein
VAPPQLQSRTEETVFVRSSTVYLRIEECGRKLQELRLGHEPLTIGRAADNDVVIGARCVSLRHARIDPEGFGHRIVDLRSESGLLVRGQRVSSHLLLDGDVVRIADPSTGNFVSLTYRDVGKQAQRQPTEPVQRLPLVGELTTIGREREHQRGLRGPDRQARAGGRSRSGRSSWCTTGRRSTSSTSKGRCASTRAA